MTSGEDGHASETCVVMSVNLDAKVICPFVAESRELSPASKEVQLRDAHVKHLG